MSDVTRHAVAAADWLKLKEGDKCTSCGLTYAACVRRIMNRQVRGCCVECCSTETHNVRMRLSEDQFKTKILKYAKLRGWRVVHFRPARTKHGWRTPFEGDEGFVDIVIARDGEPRFIETKSSTGKLGKGQPEWGKALGDYYRLWTPADWPLIEAELR